MATMPTRIDGDLFESARAAGQIHSRSAAQQLDHWARIGRQLEASPAVTHDAIERVLLGTSRYDDVDERAQAVIRATWEDEIATRIGELDFTEDLHATGLPWAEADGGGEVVIRQPGSPTS